MRLRILLFALVSTTLAQERNTQRPVRTSAAEIKYSDPNGLKVDWKLFAPQNQWRTHLENSQRRQRGQSDLVTPYQPVQAAPQSQLLQSEPAYGRLQFKPEALAEAQSHQNQIRVQYRVYQQPSPEEQQQDLNQAQFRAYQQAHAQLQAQQGPTQVQYRPYQQGQSSLEAQPESNQIQYKSYQDAQPKQEILDNYGKPERQYPDQTPVLYGSNYADPQQQEQLPSRTDDSNYEHLRNNYNEQHEQSKARREYSNKGLQGRIVYKDDYEQSQQPQPAQQEYVSVPYERIPDPPNPQLYLSKDMPKEIQELLKFQAQLPYNVIANSITHNPKAVFVPQPLPENSRSSRYTSKVYYLNNGRYEPEFENTKPVQEYHGH
ncbi:putative cyclin-dependent serine/threonine-protein kinase DDB_G0272797/DDB_G0274007 [Hylaeus volcanicus]|uniref:putative cyclin-dependent serine/threonine-protein kinase DDB_G0272797/DDB_G0274007 n=1 Tax=Hylaeus volcanicus TaxID=313075 RepID=UPI0023B7D413|nr:putative cyclin-dependent serine/threonine-protein kinase DDB_G0272797/DDB_G0274007 [Hylaeus volcanicus]